MTGLKLATLIAAFVSLLILNLNGENSPIEPVKYVDLNRYIGRWYEIARLPNKFQRNCESNTTAEYFIIGDGKIRVINSCRRADGELIRAEGIAKVVKSDKSNAKLKVRFAPTWIGWLPFVWGDYWVIDLDSNYTYAVVGEPSRKYLWILSRTPQIDNPIYESILERLRLFGYDTEKLVPTPQNWNK